MKKNVIVALCLYLLMYIGHASADIYKCTGDGGVNTFVDGNTKTNYKNCQIVMRENGVKNPSNKQATPTPNDFPKINKQTQIQRDDKRKEILLSELNAEKKALELAQNQSVQNDITMHQKNIELLKKEVGALK